MQYEIQPLKSGSGEQLARRMLSAATGLPPAAFSILRDCRGKPYWQGGNLCFNYSHAGEKLLCAVHTAPVGADIEKIGDYRERVARRVCTPAEYRYIGGDAVRFLEVWTRKEAYAKYTGRGLSVGLRNITVATETALTPTVGSCAVLTARQDGYVFSVVWETAPKKDVPAP